MAQVSAKLRSYEGGFAHWCPGCESMHMIAVSEPFPNSARWSFDGELDRPTFSPSVHIAWEGLDPPITGPLVKRVCHYFLTAGRLQFLGDCTHALKGQTVDLPDLPEHVRSDRWAD